LENQNRRRLAGACMVLDSLGLRTLDGDMEALRRSAFFRLS